MIKKLLRQPPTYLLLQAVCITVIFAGVHGTHILKDGDAESYAAFNMSSLEVALSQIRTLGYPLFLRLVRVFSPDLAMLTYAQIWMYFGAVLVFYAALRCYGFEKWDAFAAATPLLYQRIMWEYGAYLVSDLPAVSLAVISVSLLVLATVKGDKLWVWIGLVVSVFLTYQMRPAYLFMIPLLPVLAILLLGLHDASPRWKSRSVKMGGAVLAVCLAPFICYCLLRLAVVGSFAPVSFTGHHLLGITTQFLNRDMVKGFDEDLRPLALAIIDARERNDLGPPGGRGMIPMPDMVGYSVGYQQLFGKIGPRFLDRKAAQAERFRSTDPWITRVVELDRMAVRLALSIVKARPGILLLYYLKAFIYSISFTMYAEGTIVVLLLLLFAFHLMGICRNMVKGMPSDRAFMSSNQYRNFNAILFLGILYFLAKVLLCVSVEVPVGRFLVAASVFVPSMLATALYMKVRNDFVGARTMLPQSDA